MPATQLTPAQVLQLAKVVGTSFARREPQCRHLQPAKLPLAGIRQAFHSDWFGTSTFGPWNTESLMYWFIRLLVLTDPASPRDAIEVKADTLNARTASRNGSDRRKFGGPRRGIVSLSAPPITSPVSSRMLGAQDAEALQALSVTYPEFGDAHAAGRVGHHFMVARSDALPKADAFELVASTAAHYRTLGHAFVVTEATSQWTGAACETLGATRVHFAPFRAHRTVRPSAEPLADTVTSPDGFLSSKDSGSMLYVLRLA